MSEGLCLSPAVAVPEWPSTKVAPLNSHQLSVRARDGIGLAPPSFPGEGAVLQGDARKGRRFASPPGLIAGRPQPPAPPRVPRCAAGGG